MKVKLGFVSNKEYKEIIKAIKKKGKKNGKK